VSLYQWLLFFHVLAAFMLVAGLVAYGVVVLGDGRGVARRALAAPALALWNAGGLGVLALGIALVIHVDGYDLLDGWILAAIVLWFVASGAGGPLSRVAREDPAGLGRGRARMLFAVMALATALLLVDMIFKPGV
jgi:hypothetical protein